MHPSYYNYTAGSGNLYDSGGATGNYTDDERELIFNSALQVQLLLQLRLTPLT